MTFFDEVFAKLFKKKNTATVPVVHEQLVRSPKQEAAYQEWRSKDKHLELLETVADAMHKKKLGILSELDVHLLNTPYSNGIAISYHEKVGEEPFRNLFDYFKEYTLGLDYKLAQADRRILDKGTYEESIEKWYLKPAKLGADNELVNQLYGNVLLEHVLIDRKPSFIKLMVNVYQDRSYTKALDFDEYLENLFNSNTSND